MTLLKDFSSKYKRSAPEYLSVKEYLDLCKKDPMAYATPAQRLLKAIGEPKIVDTTQDLRLSRIFSNEPVLMYEVFKDFYGTELAIEKFVSFVAHAAQGLEEATQIGYLNGPPGGGKSAFIKRCKELMESIPFWAIEGSPIFESPLGLFSSPEQKQQLIEQYGIPKHILTYIPSGWLLKRLDEAEGDLSKIRVIKLYPSELAQVGIGRLEPSDPNNQDVSSVIGKISIRKLGTHNQQDPDAYNYTGVLCKGNRGIVEMVECFKGGNGGNQQTLNPLLVATQEHTYLPTNGMGSLPFEGLILAHSNEADWEQCRNNPSNEAFIDRTCVIHFPYNLRRSEEVKIYKKMLNNSMLFNAPCAPKTVEILADFIVMSRLHVPQDNSGIDLKMKIYDGDNLKDREPMAKTIPEYKKEAGVDEGSKGLSTRFAYKVLSETFNTDVEEVAADPINLFYVLEQRIKLEHLSKNIEEKYQLLIGNYLKPEYLKFISKQINRCLIEEYYLAGQDMFNNYINYARCWLEDQDYVDPVTHMSFDRPSLQKRLEDIEKPAGVINNREFRNEAVRFCDRFAAKNNGKLPAWDAYEDLKEAIEKKLFTNIEDLLPVISFEKKGSKEEESRHQGYVKRMVDQGGYTEKQVRRVTNYFMRHKSKKD